VRGDSPLIAALSVLPMAAAMMPMARTAPILVNRFGTRIVCATGLVCIAGGLLVLAQLTATSSYWLVVAGLIPLGAGMGAAMTPATSAITEALPASEQGVGSAMNDLSRELGGALGIAVIGSILAASYRSSLRLPGVPAAVADRARDSIAIAAHIGGTVSEQANTAFTSGMHTALLYAAAAAFLAAIAVTALLRGTSDNVESTVEDPTDSSYRETTGPRS
jgi:sugar phosphate permease